MYNQNRHPQQQAQAQAIRLPDAGDFGTLAVHAVKTFAKKNKVITTSYVFGLFILIFAGAGTKLTWDQRQQYERIMNTVDLAAEMNAANRYYSSKYHYDQSKGWFSCDAMCTRAKERMQRDKLKLDEIRRLGQSRMSDAKATAGIFSEIGVSEVKDSFWEYFASGKQFAKRQSMWDAMFMGMRSMGRDESMLEYAFKVLMQVLINFSMGLVMALLFFVFGLWSIVKSYQPNPLTALMFFLSAVCASFAFVATYLFAIYGLAAGGVYGVAKVAEAQLRLEAGNNNRQRRNNNPYQRPHFQ